jgi:hypothetical protein
MPLAIELDTRLQLQRFYQADDILMKTAFGSGERDCTHMVRLGVWVVTVLY